MRLICPQCGAQYEVAAEAIPPEGRDVQCSACGRLWFKRPEPLAEPSPPEPEPGPGPTPRPRRSVSPEVAEILREEARREAEARRAEAAGLPSAEPPADAAPPVSAPEGPPLPSGERSEASPSDPVPAPPPGGAGGGAGSPSPEGAEEPAGPDRDPPEAPDDPARLAFERQRQRAEEARRRMARLKGEPAPHPGAAIPASPVSRRDRLPDIETINESLDLPAAGAPRPAPPPRAGFRLGFGSALAVAALLALLYVWGPRIAASVPGTGLVLEPYVTAVDRGRLWLDRRMRDWLGALDPEAGAAARSAAGPAAPAEPAPDPAGPEPSAPAGGG